MELILASGYELIVFGVLSLISATATTTTQIISAENQKKAAEIEAQQEMDAIMAENAQRAAALRAAQAATRSLAAAGGIDPFSGSPEPGTIE